MKDNLFYLGNGDHVGGMHLRARKPGQDRSLSADIIRNDEIFRYGFIFDGSSAGVNSEFGAIHARNHLKREVERLILEDCELFKVPQILFNSLETELWRLLPPNVSKNELVHFVTDNLLFTVSGFVQGPGITVILNLSDGIILINGEEIAGKHDHEDQEDAPDYIGYRLLTKLDSKFWEKYTNQKARNGLVVYEPQGHFNVTIIPTIDINSLAIGSDAWLWENEYKEQLLWKLVQNIDIRNSDYVQEQINEWAGIPHRSPRSQLYFEDDVSAVVLHRLVEEVGVLKLATGGDDVQI